MCLLNHPSYALMPGTYYPLQPPPDWRHPTPSPVFSVPYYLPRSPLHLSLRFPMAEALASLRAFSRMLQLGTCRATRYIRSIMGHFTSSLMRPHVHSILETSMIDSWIYVFVVPNWQIARVPHFILFGTSIFEPRNIIHSPQD